MRRFARSALSLLLAALLFASPALAAPAETNVFYPQLSGLSQSLFDKLDTADVLRAFRTGESYSFTFNGPFSDPNGKAQSLIDAETPAFAAFELYHTELFWIRGDNVSIQGNNSKLVMTITPTFHYNWSGGGRSVAEDEALVNGVVQRLAAEAAAQGGAYEQLLYVHDWLTAHNEYNSAAAATDNSYDHLPWTPLSALTDVSQPVCEGYTIAFKLVCDALGIPCLFVCGNAYSNGGWGRHAWNQVLLGGKWYAVDVTFDDPTVSGVHGNVSGHEGHDFFMVGADTRVHDGMTFAGSHRADGEKISGVTFTFPALASEACSGNPAEPEPQPVPEPAPGGNNEPSALVRQDIPAAGTAVASTQLVMIGSRRIELPAYALLDRQGNPTNYVRLRDMASLLNGTDAQFDVTWSSEYGIVIDPNRPYEHPNGSEGVIPFTGNQPYTAYLQDTIVNDAYLPLTAFQITWNGGGHTYYQLRDLGRALNFNVGWSAERGIFIEPGVPYSDAD